MKDYTKKLKSSIADIITENINEGDIPETQADKRRLLTKVETEIRGVLVEFNGLLNEILNPNKGE